MSEQLLYQTPRSAWLKASAAAVRGYCAVRADLWLEMAHDLERMEAHQYAVEQPKRPGAQRTDAVGSVGCCSGGTFEVW